MKHDEEHERHLNFHRELAKQVELEKLQKRRERIATAAMQGQYASFNDVNWNRFHANRQESMESIARVAVEQADALIKELDNRSGS